MNKTILQNIHLVNWYGFSNRTIPVSENLTLISGENECGKSTILDAITTPNTNGFSFIWSKYSKAMCVYTTGILSAGLAYIPALASTKHLVYETKFRFPTPVL